MLISFIHNLGLTIKPIKGPPQGVYACPHNVLPLVGLAPDMCVCFFVLSLSMTVVSPDAQRHSRSWNRLSRAAGGGGSTVGDGGSSPGGVRQIPIRQEDPRVTLFDHRPRGSQTIGADCVGAYRVLP